ncbi:hypothetical protein H4R34_005317, partial [Dimargaris verticillata]
LKQEADRLREDKEKRQRQIGLMIKQNMKSDRPVWDVKPLNDDSLNPSASTDKK